MVVKISNIEIDLVVRIVAQKTDNLDPLIVKERQTEVLEEKKWNKLNVRSAFEKLTSLITD